MTQWRRTAGSLAAMAIVFALLLLLFSGQATRAQDDNNLTPGVSAESELASRLGEEWTFQACAGDVVTIIMESDEFDPYLEVYDAVDDGDPVAEAGSEDGVAVIEELEIEQSGPHLIIAAGERRRDQGAYTLTLEMAEESVDEVVDGVIAAGGSVTGTLRARRAVALGFRGCEGQTITAEAVSDDFDAYLELYPNGSDEILAEDDNSGRLTDARIEEFTLPETGSYVLLVSGATRRDAGDFTLSLSMDGEEASQAKAATSTPIPTRKVTVRLTPRPTATLVASGSSSSSSASSAPAPAASTGAIAAPQLVAPPDMASFDSGRLTFQWKWNGTLAENQGFEVRGWRLNGPHNGIHDARITQGITPGAGGVYSLSRKIPEEFRGQEWYWTVAVVQLDPYKRSGPEATPRKIVPARASGGGGGGGGQPGSPLDPPESPLSRP